MTDGIHIPTFEFEYPAITLGKDPKILPVIHFGPSYPPEDAYFRKLISYDSAVKCCRLNGHYPSDTAASTVRWDIGTTVAESRNEQIRNLAYFLWVDAGKPVGQELQNWHLANELISRYEELVDCMHRGFPTLGWHTLSQSPIVSLSDVAARCG